MHEPAIAAELLELVKSEIARAGYPNARVASVSVRIGALRGVVADSLQFAFQALRVGTPLENARLQIEHTPVAGVCRTCGAPFQPKDPIFICDQCGSGDIELQSGSELDLTAIEIETDETD
jgi:hydrogenase nickel incorporation protein HypA/HybF